MQESAFTFIFSLVNFFNFVMKITSWPLMYLKGVWNIHKRSLSFAVWDQKQSNGIFFSVVCSMIWLARRDLVVSQAGENVPQSAPCTHECIECHSHVPPARDEASKHIRHSTLERFPPKTIIWVSFNLRCARTDVTRATAVIIARLYRFIPVTFMRIAIGIQIFIPSYTPKLLFHAHKMRFLRSLTAAIVFRSIFYSYFHILMKHNSLVSAQNT